MGAVVLPVVFTGLNGRKVTQAMRFKIFARGGSGWMGLIIGGPSLEPPPLGLGLRSHGGGHHLEAFEMTIARCEAEELRCRFDVFFAAKEGVDCSPLGQRDRRKYVAWEEMLGWSVHGIAGKSLASLSIRMDNIMEDARSSVSWGIMMTNRGSEEEPTGVHAYHQRAKEARGWELCQGIWQRRQSGLMNADRRGLTPGEAGAIGLGQTCSGNSAGDGPDLPLTFFDRERTRYPWVGTAHQVGQ